MKHIKNSINPYHAVELHYCKTDSDDKDTFCDLRVWTQAGFVDIDVTVVQPQSAQ